MSRQNTNRKSKRDSEFQSYTYIKNELKDKGWNVNNPNRDPRGQVYTQQECLQNSEIASRWEKLHPEYVVKLAEDKFWVIEAKPTHEELDKAFEEATEYGKLLNQHKFVRAMIVTGVAGNDIDRYLVKNAYWIEDKKHYEFIVYEGKEITSLLNPAIANRLIGEDTPVLKEFDIPDSELLKASDHINKAFHLASIRKDKRATIVATMLLSLLGDTDPNYNAKPDVFVGDINLRAKDSLEENGKEAFFKYIEIQLPNKADAKLKFKNALVDAFFTLRKINIKAAMRTGSDVLGRFYEAFLKYGNGAKDLGIVLTPRNVTEFATEVLNVNYKDIVYDPTCGTGGFLVSSFYHVMKNSNRNQLESFRLHRIFGIDQQSTVATLAIVNMIFRGDGRNHITNDDCLARGVVAATLGGQVSGRVVSRDAAKKGHKVVTKILMNPPFALKKGSEKEFVFVNHALDQMEDGGLLFAVMPCAALVKGGAYKTWRSNLLKQNTLLSIITFVEDLFYPQSQPPALAIILKKGVPHNPNQKVLWVKIRNDGYRKVKGKRLPDPKILDEMDKVKSLVQTFLVNPSIKVENIPEFQKASPIDIKDPNLELIPEAYLDERLPTIDEMRSGVEDAVRDTVAFLIRTGKEKVIKND
jgi:type I restriction-modification system DNA methylase subunit